MESFSWEDPVNVALDLEQDAIHPLFLIPPDGVETALGAGLQVNVWGIFDGPLGRLSALLTLDRESGETGIITDDPGTLEELFEERQ